MINLNKHSIKELLHYDPDTGVFTWKRSRSSRAKVGEEAGSVRKETGYRTINVSGKPFLAHRLAFFYMTGVMPTAKIDHINGDRSDNRWENLRDVSQAENSRNQRPHRSNKSGVTGVRYIKTSGKWLAEIRFDYVLNHIGLFDDKFEAICARKSAENALGFHANHGLLKASA